jgi:hypothetical protein
MRRALGLRSACGAVVRGALLLVLGGCGEPVASKSDGWLRVEISGNSTDKPWPSAGFRLKSADGREIALSVASGVKGEGPVLEGRGAPGIYALIPPAGWRGFGEADALDIRLDVPPVKIGVGKKHSIYVWPPQGRAVSALRCTRMPHSEQPLEIVEVESLIADDGSAVLRVPPAAWNGTLRIHAIVGAATFAKIVPVVFAERSIDGDPFATILEPAYSAPIAVRVVRSEVTSPPAPVELMASIGAEPLQIGVSVPIDAKGRGEVPEVPREVTKFALFVRGEQAWDGLEAARLFREVRLFVSTEGRLNHGDLAVRLSHVKGDARPVLQVRQEGGATYAVPSFTEARDGEGSFFLKTSLPAGRYHVLVTCGGGAALSSGPVEIVGGKPAKLELKAAAVASLRVALEGGIGSIHSWMLVARRLEGEAEIEAQGFVVRGVARADVDLELPPGRYRVRAVVESAEGPMVDIDLSTPGTHASIDLKPK